MLVLTACGGAAQGDESATPDSSTAVSASVGAATATSTAESGIIQKRVGELAGNGCAEGDGFDSCDVRFTMTSLTRGEVCDGYVNPRSIDPLPADKEVVRFEMEVETAPSFKHESIATMFYAQYWSVVDAEGYSTKDPDIAIGCSNIDYNGVYEYLEPGTKLRASVPIVVPKGATTIRVSERGVGFEWPIPA